MAEAFTNNLTDHVAISAWIDDVWKKYEYRPYEPAVDLLYKKYGIDMSQQKAKHLTEDMIDDVQKVFLLCSQDECTSLIPDYILSFPELVIHYVSDPNHLINNNLKSIADYIYSFVVDALWDDWM